jgi:hypothetical protein
MLGGVQRAVSGTPSLVFRPFASLHHRASQPLSLPTSSSPRSHVLSGKRPRGLGAVSSLLGGGGGLGVVGGLSDFSRRSFASFQTHPSILQTPRMCPIYFHFISHFFFLFFFFFFFFFLSFILFFIIFSFFIF